MVSIYKLSVNSAYELILTKLAPLYFFIAVGFLASKIFKVSREVFSSFLIYFIAPIMIFSVLLRAPVNGETFYLPVLYLTFSTFIAVTMYLGVRFFVGSTHNLFAFGSGNANTGYFGIPVTAALVGADAVYLAVLVALGLILYENTVGYFISARAHASARVALHKLLRLPTIYAVVLAVAWRLVDLPLASWITDTGDMARVTYSVLGFVIIGIGLGSVRLNNIDLKYSLFSQLSKFVVWPLLTLLFLWGINFLGISFSDMTTKVMAVMAFVPMAANTVVFASLLNVEPEKAAVAVFLSTVFSVTLFISGAPEFLLLLAKR